MAAKWCAIQRDAARTLSAKGRKPGRRHRQEDYRYRNGPSGRHIGTNKLRENRTEENERLRIGQVRNHPEPISAPPSHVINTASRDCLFRVILGTRHHGRYAADLKPERIEDTLIWTKSLPMSCSAPNTLGRAVITAESQPKMP